MQNVFSKGRKWDFYQSAELDVNRGWRKEKSGHSLTLSNFYFSAHWRPIHWANIALTYDNRRNYWTYETRSLLDSLFDDALRQGLRLFLNARLPLHISIYMNAGVRKRSTDADATYSYSFSIYKYNFLFTRLHLNLQISGFSNPLGDGYNFSTTLRKFMANGISWGIGTGTYAYRASTIQRLNQWYRFDWQIPLLHRFYLSFSGELERGDDVKGYRIFSEFRYMF